MFAHLLSVMIFLPIVAGLVLLCAPLGRAAARGVGFGVSLAVLVLGVEVYCAFRATGGLELVEYIPWIPTLGIAYHLGIDGISLFILMTCAVLLPLVHLLFDTREKGYYANLLLVEGAMIGALCALDMVLFYVFWELMLLPVFFMLGLYGGPGRLPATLKITLYTIAGSLLMLASLVFLAVQYHALSGEWSFSIQKIGQLDLAGPAAALALFGFMIAFAIKIPLFPFHTWLPDAYTEAPTATTFVLSALMAKIGVYGVIRLVLPCFELEFARYALLFASAGVVGMMYCGLAALAQKDYKRLLAFSSASHMGIIAVGVCSMNELALTGAIYQIVAHATSTGVLFLFAGILEERTRTRNIADLGGIAVRAPLFSLFFAIAMLASMGLPGTSGFIGEFLIILGALRFSLLIAVFTGTTLIIGVCYMLWLFQRVFFEKGRMACEQFRDLGLRETLALVPVILLIILMGVYPHPFLQKIEPSTHQLFLTLQAADTQGDAPVLSEALAIDKN